LLPSEIWVLFPATFLFFTFPSFSFSFLSFSFLSFSFPFFSNNLDCITEGYWNSEKNRRTFLDNFAAKRNLDPLNPETWYPIEKSHLLDEKVFPIFKKK
jgi:hypothetical protein